MKLEHDISQRQIQRIIMTPELRMSINILQMPSFELMNLISQALAENPLLEELPESEASDSGSDSKADMGIGDGSGDYFNNDIYRVGVKDEREDGESDWEAYLEEEGSLYPYGGAVSESVDDTDYSYANSAENGITLEEHLLFQLSLYCKDPVEMRVGEYIIGNLDENGYLTCGVEDVANIFNLPVEKVEEILAIIQGVEPAGVAARSLEESLLIQLDNCDIDDELYFSAKGIISGYLGDLAKGCISKIATELGISSDLVQKAKDLIHTFDPKPGRSFSNQRLYNYIVPDIIVRKIDDNYAIIPNDSLLPRLTINPQYKEALRSDSAVEADVLNFIKERLESALWLIRSIEHRRMTIYRITEAIIEHQRDFFEKGIRYLRPMTMKEIADAIGVHESTVSRATTGKYIDTPSGIFELKFFFSSSIGMMGGGSTSSESIKILIKEIIDSEEPKKPLSDQQITRILRSKGIVISRRTVAKYRDEMLIPPAASRRRF